MPAILHSVMKKTLTLFVLLFSLSLVAQRPRKAPEGPAWLIMPSFGLQYAGGDMADKFGQSYAAGLGIGYKTSKNWQFAFQGQFMFGTDVKNTAQILQPVLTQSGYIFNQGGEYAIFAIDQRGAYGTIDFSKTIPNFFAANRNSGFNLSLGAGYLAHWIRINNVGDDAPQILDDYKDGYDQLSGGFLLKQSVGYQFMSVSRRVNFRLSFEVMEAFTTNYRKYNYSTGQAVSGKMLDMVYGFRLEWILPIYNQPSNEYFYD